MQFWRYNIFVTSMNSSLPQNTKYSLTCLDFHFIDFVFLCFLTLLFVPHFWFDWHYGFSPAICSFPYVQLIFEHHFRYSLCLWSRPPRLSLLTPCLRRRSAACRTSCGYRSLPRTLPQLNRWAGLACDWCDNGRYCDKHAGDINHRWQWHPC